MKKVLLICMVIFLLVIAGCSNSPQIEKSTSSTTQSTSEKIDANTIYDKIQTGMTFEQVQSLIGKEPISKAESVADTPNGKIEIKNYSWQVGKTIITVIFENGKVTMKNKTSM